MPDIKVKPKNELKIRKFDATTVYTQKLKDNIVSINTKTNNTNNTNNENNDEIDYGINQIEEKAQILSNKGIRTFNKYGQKSVIKTKNNIEFAKNRIKKKIENDKIIKTKENITNARKYIEEDVFKSVLNNKITSYYSVENKTRKAIKDTPKRIKQAEKVTKQTVKTSVKVAKKSYQIAKVAAKTTIKVARTTIKTMITVIKSIISATQALIAAILAGGWIAIVIVIIICLIGMICSSIYGIFFSNENGVNLKSMSSVVSETNKEFTNKITEIQNTNEHDEYEINSHRTEWKDVISVYTVIITGGKEQSDAITLDDNKIQKLKDIFWEMNTISSRVKDVEKNIEIIDDNGNTHTEKVIRKVLYIDIQGKSVEEMASIYNFNNRQLEQLEELRNDKYKDLWSNVLYGSSGGSTNIVDVAFAQLGNVGGQPYWSWYGFESRVSWCACFVSWCANECGYIDMGIIPKFANCQNEGIVWFKTCGLWQDGGYIPKTRRNNIF